MPLITTDSEEYKTSKEILGELNVFPARLEQIGRVLDFHGVNANTAAEALSEILDTTGKDAVRLKTVELIFRLLGHLNKQDEVAPVFNVNISLDSRADVKNVLCPTR